MFMSSLEVSPGAQINISRKDINRRVTNKLLVYQYMRFLRLPDKSALLKIFFLISQSNICCGCSKESSQ